MSSAAFRFFAVLPGLFALLQAPAAEPVIRVTPQRPGAVTAPTPVEDVPTKNFGRIAYVSLPDVAARLGGTYSWRERGKRLVLTGPGGRAELENDNREINLNGLRVFLGDPVLDARGELFVSRTDFERCLAPLLRPGYGGAPPRAPRIVVLDPGHGGKDNGTSAHEKTYALDVARRAKPLLEAAGFQVVLTRTTDVFMDLTQRGAAANAARGDLFVSIHFNALVNDTKTSGIEVFTFAPRLQRSTNSWSLRESDDTEREPAPANRHDQWSTVLAHALHGQFVKDLKAFDRGKKIAHWGVLRALNCPGVLIECGFLTSSTEARKIATSDYRQKIATALVAGIRGYASFVEAAKSPGSPPAGAGSKFLSSVR